MKFEIFTMVPNTRIDSPKDLPSPQGMVCMLLPPLSQKREMN